jgi:hypothetical protein
MTDHINGKETGAGESILSAGQAAAPLPPQSRLAHDAKVRRKE